MNIFCHCIGKSWRKHHVINYVTALDHQQHRWRESRYDSSRMSTKKEKDEMRSRLQTAMKAKQRAGRFRDTSDVLRCQVKPTGSSQTETETETAIETESKYSLATRTSNIAVVAVSGEHDGDQIGDQPISCKRKQIRCHATEVKQLLYFCSFVTQCQISVMTQDP